ncbi:DNA/pantothenate metabolism flavo protein [Coniella lustricola]|uniref:DNA/pantothenate metabolism flavo protein n=1 Tax=Coniella lustricola TaxID=2025994 RepID=A0A2T3A6L1_9PEZI|nr:DNA/pantothenate metabolism flavo protein [Coniella lustricola]
MAPSAEATPTADEDQYFHSNPPPKALPEHIAQAQAFIDLHAAANRRVVLVTSGGTTVPLEKQTVRFIDNFSAGTRGATSAEYFLESGYAVIFLHRQFSLLPYSRHYSHATDCFLDFLDEGEGGIVIAKPAFNDTMLSVLRKYQTATRNKLLLTLPFVTIGDYLHELRAIARLMHRLGPHGLLYLAAAASDFFLPQDRMAEHKIQSTDAADSVTNKSNQKKDNVDGGGGGATTRDEEFDNFDSTTKVPRSKRLIVDLDPVPKFLKNLVDGWAPQCMIVSFKLETDPGILVHKAKKALDRYSHNLVIGNLLSTRKWEVVFVAPGRPDKWIRIPSVASLKTSSSSTTTTTSTGHKRSVSEMEGTKSQQQQQQQQHGVAQFAEDKPLDPALLPEGDPDVAIESLIIPALEELHTAHIRDAEEKVVGENGRKNDAGGEKAAVVA